MDVVFLGPGYPGEMPLFRKRTRKPVTTSVTRPQIVPRGMSRSGSADSSAASNGPTAFLTFSSFLRSDGLVISGV